MSEIPTFPSRLFKQEYCKPVFAADYDALAHFSSVRDVPHARLSTDSPDEGFVMELFPGKIEDFSLVFVLDHEELRKGELSWHYKESKGRFKAVVTKTVKEGTR